MLFTLMAVVLLAAGDKEASDALSRFSVEFKAKEVDARVAAVTELAQIQHEKIHSKLGALLTTDVREVRVAAAKGLAGAQENKKKVVSYLTNGFLANQNDVVVEAAVIDALDRIKEGQGRSLLETVIKSGEVDAAKSAVNTIGECRKKELLESLISMYKWLDARAKEYQTAGPRARGYVGRGIGDPGPTVDPEAPKRAKSLGPVISQVLCSLTGAKLATSQEWDDWWQKNGSSFKFP
jgi:hypothetical protein